MRRTAKSFSIYFASLYIHFGIIIPFLLALLYVIVMIIYVSLLSSFLKEDEAKLISEYRKFVQSYNVQIMKAETQIPQLLASCLKRNSRRKLASFIIALPSRYRREMWNKEYNILKTLIDYVSTILNLICRCMPSLMNGSHTRITDYFIALDIRTNHRPV